MEHEHDLGAGSRPREEVRGAAPGLAAAVLGEGGGEGSGAGRGCGRGRGGLGRHGGPDVDGEDAALWDDALACGGGLGGGDGNPQQIGRAHV